MMVEHWVIFPPFSEKGCYGLESETWICTLLAIIGLYVGIKINDIDSFL